MIAISAENFACIRSVQLHGPGHCEYAIDLDIFSPAAVRRVLCRGERDEVSGAPEELSRPQRLRDWFDRIEKADGKKRLKMDDIHAIRRALEG